MRRRTFAAAAIIWLALGSAPGIAEAPSEAGSLRFRVSFDRSLRAATANGRVYVIVSNTSDPEPRFQVDILGPPLWGEDVQGMAPGEHVTLDSSAPTYGYPIRRLDRLPPGDYTVQAFLNVYRTFHRSDGSVVQLHMPCGDGQYFFDSPGNLFSTPEQLHLAPEAGTFDLQLDHVVPPADPVPPGGTCQQGNPPDSAHVGHVKIESSRLTEFWGRPTFIAANVLLPRGYNAPDNASIRYPVVYLHGHFPFGNPFGFEEHGDDAFSRWWLSDRAPRIIVVELRHETPYFDDSYAVNSANLGPYGDAIVRDLIPEIQRKFRIIDAPWARTLAGGSTGGWEALAQQVFYPGFYAGTWSLCPDPVDFSFHQLVDIYSDANAYVTRYDWEDVPRPSARVVPGDTIWTMEQENHWELALGTRGRSGLGQWDIWQAVYGPQGADGYPAPIWNKQTGKIHRTVADAWRSMDLHAYLRSHWPSIGPKLVGKLHIFVGDDDTFFLNNAVELLAPFLRSVTHPHAQAEVRFGNNEPHCWSPYSDTELLTIMAQAMSRNVPLGANRSAFRGAASTASMNPPTSVTSSAYGRRSPGDSAEPGS